VIAGEQPVCGIVFAQGQQFVMLEFDHGFSWVGLNIVK
jgi:hypothetical protein